MKRNRATIVIDLAFGDCGKGTIVDYLARQGQVHTVVRFNGGPQAGHNVVTSAGQHHTFAQIGSGTLAGPGVRTLLSRFMLVEPYALLKEVAHLEQLGVESIWDRLSMDARCVVITPAHQAANRLQELARGSNCHGSCGQGVGEATADHLKRPDLTLRVGDLSNAAKVAATLRAVVASKVEQMREIIPRVRHLQAAIADMDTLLNPRWIEVAVETYAAVASAANILSPNEANLILKQDGEVIFEGAQGVLLDQDFGFHPHTTWSRTTSTNAEQLLRDAGITETPHRIGVLRSYFTRHGAGPFVSENDSLRALLPEPHNNNAGYQGRFRVGIFDAVAARYAAEAGGVDEVALTHLDRLSNLPSHICTEYRTQEDTILRLRHDRNADAWQQKDLTSKLLRSRPVFKTLAGNGTDVFVAEVQRLLNLPIRLLSFGPTAEDKREWKP